MVFSQESLSVHIGYMYLLLLFRTPAVHECPLRTDSSLSRLGEARN